jgi:hypothetical protein
MQLATGILKVLLCGEAVRLKSYVGTATHTKNFFRQIAPMKSGALRNERAALTHPKIAVII